MYRQEDKSGCQFLLSTVFESGILLSATSTKVAGLKLADTSASLPYLCAWALTSHTLELNAWIPCKF